MIALEINARAIARAISALAPRRLEQVARVPQGAGDGANARPGTSGAASSWDEPDEDTSDEDTERRTWSGPRRRIRLPLMIRWGQTPGQRRSKAGTWYIRVPLRGGAGGGPPVIRTITPSSPGWLVPDRRSDPPQARVAAAQSRAASTVPRSALPPSPVARPEGGGPTTSVGRPAPPATSPRTPTPPPTSTWTARTLSRVRALVIGAFNHLQ